MIVLCYLSDVLVWDGLLFPRILSGMGVLKIPADMLLFELPPIAMVGAFIRSRSYRMFVQLCMLVLERGKAMRDGLLGDEG